MSAGDGPPERTPPRAEQLEAILGSVPLLEAYFRHAHTALPAELTRLFARYHLTDRHAAALGQLAVTYSLSVSELAHRMRVTVSTASELVGDLTRAGLVERREDPTSRRRTLASLDRQQRATVEAFLAARSAPLLRTLDELSPRDREGFARGLVTWARETNEA